MSPSPRTGAPPNPQQVLASIWQRSLPIVRQRIDTLSAAARSATDGRLSAAAQKDAADIAHKLAGSLGMFGYPRGTEIAQELEVLLDSDTPISGTRLEELTSQLSQSLEI